MATAALEWLTAIWAWFGTVTLTLREAFLFVVLAVLVTLYVSARAFIPAETGSSDAFQPGFTQEDGSKGLPLIPMDESSAPPPAHDMPKKARRIRDITVTVQPAHVEAIAEPALPGPDGTCPVPAYQCPAVRVDLSIIRDQKGIYRTIASSPDGDVIGGMDIPFHDFEGPAKRNTLLIFGNPMERAGGAAYTRNVTLFGEKIGVGGGVMSVPQDPLIPMAAVKYDW